MPLLCQGAMSYAAGVTRSQQRGTWCPLSFFQTYTKADGRGCPGDGKGRQSRAGPTEDEAAVVFFM